MKPSIETLQSTSTVNDVVRRYPTTTGVFNHFGIDACCGGASSLREAAERDGADLPALLSALEAAIGGPADSADGAAACSVAGGALGDTR